NQGMLRKEGLQLLLVSRTGGSRLDRCWRRRFTNAMRHQTKTLLLCVKDCSLDGRDLWKGLHERLNYVGNHFLLALAIHDVSADAMQQTNFQFVRLLAAHLSG